MFSNFIYIQIYFLHAQQSKSLKRYSYDLIPVKTKTKTKKSPPPKKKLPECTENNENF